MRSGLNGGADGSGAGRLRGMSAHLAVVANGLQKAVEVNLYQLQDAVGIRAVEKQLDAEHLLGRAHRDQAAALGQDGRCLGRRVDGREVAGAGGWSGRAWPHTRLARVGIHALSTAPSWRPRSAATGLSEERRERG